MKVKATDSAGNSSVQTLGINVDDIDDTAPTITGPSGGAGSSTSSKSINENTTAVHTFSASEAVTWSLNGGADASKFNINSSTGLLLLNLLQIMKTQQILGGITNMKYELELLTGLEILLIKF